MANQPIGKKDETLSREELLKKLKMLEDIMSTQENKIRGQNFTIQLLTSQNLMLRDLLDEIKMFEPGLFSGGKWTKLKTKILDTLDKVRGK